VKSLVLTALIVLLSGCTERTEFGSCIGLADEKDPKLVYKLDATNLVVGLVFIELIVPPVVVAVDETFCPVGRK